jgi:adenine/guanine phosphoribosyltransferase-like PRPP-binding protein
LAKNHADTDAALSIMDDLIADEVLDGVVDLCRDARTPPIVIAPSVAATELKNALGVSYAAWLASELGYQRCDTMYQVRRVRRDLNNGWYRLANPTAFDGHVEPNRDYIIADDVCTLGGTLAEARSFIEAHGSRVIGMTTIASPSGNHVQLALSRQSHYGLASEYGDAIDAFWREEFGYGTEALTEPEARYLLGHGPGVDRIRDAIRRARYDGDVREA